MPSALRAEARAKIIYERLASDPDSDPVTGAELGAGPPVPQGREPGKPDGA
nr:hypothetical protein [Burkholderia cenocepacia]